MRKNIGFYELSFLSPGVILEEGAEKEATMNPWNLPVGMMASVCSVSGSELERADRHSAGQCRVLSCREALLQESLASLEILRSWGLVSSLQILISAGWASG